MTIEELMIQHKVMSDTITLEFGKHYDSTIAVFLNEDELFSINTTLDCYKFDLGYYVEDYELEEVKNTLKLIKKMINLVLKHREE